MGSSLSSGHHEVPDSRLSLCCWCLCPAGALPQWCRRALRPQQRRRHRRPPAGQRRGWQADQPLRSPHSWFGPPRPLLRQEGGAGACPRYQPGHLPQRCCCPLRPQCCCCHRLPLLMATAHGYYPFLGAANVHPAAAVVYGRKKREAQVPVNLVTGHTATAYLNPFFGHHVAIAPVTSPFTAHPNGALVPAEPADVVEAREAHLAAVAGAGRKKREAQVPVNLVTGLAATTYINPFFGHHLAVAPVTSPFTAYPNGALVPEEPAGVAEARAAHLEALAAASK